MAVTHLRELRLLLPPTEDDRDTLDCHPLLREHFAEEMRGRDPEAWREAHNRLYEHFKQAGKQLPETLDEMQPLFAAVYHGCQAGRHQNALSEVYHSRIQRKGGFHLINKLGAFGTDLSLLANFFDPPWCQPIASVTPANRSWLLSLAGSSLRSLGRLPEAVEPMEDGLDLAVARKDWKNAAIRAGNLSELHLTMGEVTRAVVRARQSADYADRSNDAFQQMVNLTNLADTLHQAGQAAEAERLFRKAEQMQQAREPQYPLLYSVGGYRYCDLLLAQNQPADVRRRAAQTLKWGCTRYWLHSAALDHLSFGRALPPETPEAEQYFAALKHEGVDTALVRLAGEPHYSERHPSHQVARLLLTIGWFDRYRSAAGSDR